MVTDTVKVTVTIMDPVTVMIRGIPDGGTWDGGSRDGGSRTGGRGRGWGIGMRGGGWVIGGGGYGATRLRNYTTTRLRIYGIIGQRGYETMGFVTTGVGVLSTHNRPPMKASKAVVTFHPTP